MAFRSAIAFAGAGWVVLVLGAVLRALARRQSRMWPRRSGGVVLVVAVPVGLLAATVVPTRALVIAGGAVALAGFGLVRDRVDVPRWVVPIVMVGVSVVVAASGLRFPLGGVPTVDFAWTVAWLTLVTLAVANSGNADGQLPSLAAASAFGVCFLAGFAFQSAASALFAALLGSLLAFLAYNVRPASLNLGRAGALFAGFLIASGAIWVRPSIGRPGSLLVSVLLVGVALLDGTVVVVGRLRRGRRLTVRLRDHLSHRLVVSGLRPTRMIQLLTVVQVALSVVAVFVGRDVLSVWVGALAALGLLVTLTVLALRARMRDETAPGFSWRVRLLCFGILAFVIAASAVAGASALSSRSKLQAARDAANDAIEAATDGDSARAVELFTQAERDFASADKQLGSVANLPSLLVPVVGSNMHAAREITRIGLDLSRAGRDLTEQINSDELRLVDGTVPLASVAAVSPALERASRILAASKESIDDLPRGYLVGEMDDAVRQLNSKLATASRNATTAASAARHAPFLLGDGEQRRYLLVIQNPAELRGTGGLVGNWGIITAENGKVHLDRIERLKLLNDSGSGNKKLHAPKDYMDRYARFSPETDFQNANITPDFPTAAAVMADIYAQSNGGPVDGVIAVDPVGLQALLELTGPVRVPDWPTPVSAENVVDVTLRDAYARFSNTPDRADFLGDVARAAIDRATSGDLGSLERLSRVLGKAAHEGHFALWFTEPGEQEVVDDIEISGRIPTSSGDILHVSNTNAGANKLDYYLGRTIEYGVTVGPSSDLRQAFVLGTSTVILKNDVPPSGLPQIVAGPYEGATDRFVYGQNYTFLSVYSPLTATGTRIDEETVEPEVARELGLNVYSVFVDVFSQQTATVGIDLAGRVDLHDGWYELTLVRQPTLRPDLVNIRVQVPSGFEIVDARGLDIVDGVAQRSFPLDRTRTVRVKIGSASGASLWERLQRGD